MHLKTCKGSVGNLNKVLVCERNAVYSQMSETITKLENDYKCQSLDDYKYSKFTSFRNHSLPQIKK